MKAFSFSFFLLLGLVLRAQETTPRLVLNMNEGWQFVKSDSAANESLWQSVRLPHTWNVADVMDDVPGYYRDAGWYKKSLVVKKEWKDKDISLYFEGANQETDVFINGKKAGSHIGGYTGFSVSIGNYLNWNGGNELLVKVNNRFNQNIAPLSADFTFYGGLYRDVFLHVANKVHFSTTDHGSNGVYVTTPVVSKDAASVEVKSLVSNASKGEKVYLATTVVDRAGRKIAEVKTASVLKPFDSVSIVQKIPLIKKPRLWSPENPYIYTVVTKLIDEKGKVLDVVRNPLGFRWFRFDADNGFLLNGAPYKLVGASRHQDYKGLGNAVPDSLAVNDVLLLKKMGANFLRVAHYPQDPCVLKACDSLGLLASVEIPVVNEITESDSFYRNCEEMQTEMIRQNFNHPSVIVWCYMNEVLLRPHFGGDKERQQTYFANVASLAQRLDDRTRKEDPSRYTMMVNHGSLNQYKSAGLLQIPMIIGWNLYSGWYGGSMDDFPKFLEDFHKAYPGKPFMVTEYGADADPRIRSTQPVRFDKSIEFTTRFHQFYLTEMLKRPSVAGAVVWNLADFNSETRTETMPHMNNKGLLQWDRTPKDPFYYYEAMLSKTPFIKILGADKTFGTSDSTSMVCYQSIQVATNLDSVALLVNGEKQNVQKTANGLCEWKVLLKEGKNVVVAEGKRKEERLRDSLSTVFHLQRRCLNDTGFAFRSMNILLGSSRYYRDEDGKWWQPDQPYQKGAWGFVGGQKFKLANNRLPYGTDKNIDGTEDDPVYQTQQTGIRQYRLDVLPGKYELTLYFAELLGGVVHTPPYNLNEDERDEKVKRRIFNVSVNGGKWLQGLNLAQDYGLAKAVTKTTTVTVKESEGITVDFEPVEGEPVLNALQVKKLDEQTVATQQ